MKQLSYDKDKHLIYAYNYPRIVKKAVQELQGLAGLMIFDGVIADDEIVFLGNWLEKNNELLTEFPLSDLHELFRQVVSTGEITNEDRKKLFIFLDAIASGVKSNPVIDGIFTEKAIITFEGKLFLFTGDLEFGSREKAESAVVERSGQISKSCTMSTDYLIVGNLGSEAYKYSRFGTKIDKAIEYQRHKKSSIQIVREPHFVEAVLSTPPAKPKPKKEGKAYSSKRGSVEITISVKPSSEYVCGVCNGSLEDPTEDCPSCGAFAPITTK